MRATGRRLILYFFVVLAMAALSSACGDKRAARRGASPGVAMPAVVVRRTLPPLPERPLSPKLREARARAMEAASRLRGLGWTDETGMTELSGWEYGTRTKEIADVILNDDLKALSKLAVAGGLLPEGTDLASLAVSFTAASAGATYSPLDKQVLLLSDGEREASGRNQSLLTHEFTHALQDQHFGLLALLLARPYNFDRAEAAFALVEGDAMNVERRLEGGDAWSRRTLEDIARAEDERFNGYRKELGSFFPPLLTETFIFRYRDGVRFVEAMRRSRPAVSADELFRRPPASSEQVLHPEKYLAGEAPREADLSEEAFVAEGWRLSASTPLGEVGVRGLLLAGVPVAEARRAAAGWGGDRAYIFERPDAAPLFVWRTLWDKATDAQEFYRAYNALKRARGAEQADPAAPAPGGAQPQQAVWREGRLVTLVRLEGDRVLVLRGAEGDIAPALGLAGR